MLRQIAIPAAALAALSSAPVAVSQSAAFRDATAWEIGPMIRGRNYSVGMPPHPAQLRSGIAIDIPRAPGSVHYVTTPSGSLTGKRRIVLRYRVELARGAQIVPTNFPQSPSIITLYFQRSGDNWSARQQFEAYRWYASFASKSPINAGVQELVAPLDGNWTAVMRSSAQTEPAAFADAKALAGKVGFVLGGGDGLGHGVSATGQARLVVLDFRIE